jgi:hypothetical protein
MKKILFFLILVCLGKALQAQYVYTIKADSVKITNSCDTAELIIENHTQTVPGFLFNKGRGRTEFRRVLNKISDTLVTIGPDTLHLANAWLQGGNRFNSTGLFGTLDNNHIDFYTNGLQRGRWANTGNLLIGNGPDNGYKLQLHDKGNIVFSPTLSRPNDYIIFGGYMNPDDGQNMIISTSDGTTGHAVLMERDGNIGMGWGSPTGWNVGHPTFRISANGTVSIASTSMYFGQTGGPYNSSALVTSVSSGTEWQDGGNYPNGANHYYFGTVLNGPYSGYSRAPLFIGARYLTFNTGDNDIEAARITQSGNMAIGSNEDYGQKLQVRGSARIWDSLLVQGRIIQGYLQEAQMGNGLILDRADNSSRLLGPGGIIYESRSGGDQHVFRNVIGNQFTGTMVTIDPGPYPELPDNQLALKVRARDEKDFVVTVKGWTGIGTITPSAQLHTTGSVRFAGLTNDNSLTRVVVADANGNLYYKDAASTFNGTMNSDLAVNGTVSAKKMLISQAGRWPDYVFSKQYQLPSLTEVEKFINQNSHLPGISSAAEVEKKGIDVAGNQAALLKKIEELTLYAIEQEKKLQKQSEEINELKNQNKEVESLKQQIAELRTLIISASQSKK